MSRRQLAVLLAVTWAAGAAVWACDTPVYRYAMYRWQAAPYELYFFFDSEVPEPRAAAHDLLRELPYDKRPANVAVLDVDLRDQAAMARLPSTIRQRWEESGQQAPGYLVYSPAGGKVFAGPLTPEQLRALPDSPARRQLAEQLGQGKIGVLLMLDASEQGAGDEAEQARAANAEAEQVVRDTVKKAALAPLYGFDNDAAPAGPLGQPPVGVTPDAGAGESGPPQTATDEPPAGDKNTSGDGEPPAAGPRPEVGWLRVDRHDPQEQWLVRMLLAVEPDLGEPEFLRQPMVFVVYGRGRVLPPFIGRGVRADNLMGDVQFITGACSCTVKDQNPGVDLLLRNDWERAADLLAASFGSEEGNESQLGVGELFPSLELPPAETERAPPAGDESSGSPPAASSQSPPAAAGQPPADAGEPASPEPAVAPGNDTGTDSAPPSEEGRAESHNQSDSGDSLAHGNHPTPAVIAQQVSRNLLLIVGGAVAVAVALLLGITLVVVRSP